MNAVTFRNVEVADDDPVSDWPFEAVESALDRGTLSQWRLLAAEIQRSPWGRVARAVEEATSWGDHPGVDVLMRAVLERARARVTSQGRQRWAGYLAERRRNAGLTLRELATLAGTSASRLSDYERAKVAPTTDVIARIEHAIDAATPPRREQEGRR